MHKFVFVWWGDGYFVYQDGRYIGKDDQVNFPRDFEGSAVIEVWHPEDDSPVVEDYAPESLEEIDL